MSRQQSPPKPDVRIIVSFIYFESERQSACERNNKRTNLAMFLRLAVATSGLNIHFHITFPGLKPSVGEILDSIGAEPLSDHGGLRTMLTRMLTNQMGNVIVRNSTVHTRGAADLCHHYDVLWRAVHHEGREYDYVFTLNDGVRGPFVDAVISKALVERLPFANVPLWLAKHLTLMVQNKQARLVGSVLSCQVDTHVQSSVLLIDWRVLDIALQHFKATCEPGMSWVDAIGHEVGRYRLSPRDPC